MMTAVWINNPVPLFLGWITLRQSKLSLELSSSSGAHRGNLLCRLPSLPVSALHPSSKNVRTQKFCSRSSEGFNLIYNSSCGHYNWHQNWSSCFILAFCFVFKIAKKWRNIPLGRDGESMKVRGIRQTGNKNKEGGEEKLEIKPRNITKEA